VNTLLQSVDGGQSWIDRSQGFEGKDFRSVYFAPDGRRGWISGEDGLIFATLDGGDDWYEQETGVPHRLYYPRLSGDGETVYVGSIGGVILKAD